MDANTREELSQLEFQEAEEQRALEHAKQTVEFHQSKLAAIRGRHKRLLTTTEGVNDSRRLLNG